MHDIKVTTVGIDVEPSKPIGGGWPDGSAVKALAMKTDHLSSTPRTHRLERDKGFLLVVL